MSYHIIVKQNERAATEVTTPPVGSQRVSAVPLLNNTTARPDREPLWMRVDAMIRFLRDLRASMQPLTPLERYRISQDEGSEEVTERRIILPRRGGVC